MDFKRLREERKAFYTMVIVIELMLYSKAVIFLGGVRIRNVKVI